MAEVGKVGWVNEFVRRPGRNLRHIQTIARSEKENHSDATVFEVTQLINSMLGLLVLPKERHLAN